MTSEKLILIIKLGRLHFLVAGFLLYLLGVLLAVVLFNQFSWERFIWGYAVLLPAQLMVNYSNEYFDQEVDQNSHPTKFSGGSGVLISHPELKSFSKWFSLSMIALSLILGFIFSYLFNSPAILVFTIFGNVLGWFYTAPPIRLSYRGFGEIATVLSGFLVPGLGYAAITGIINTQFIIFSIPIMLFYILFILSVEIPDRETDRLGGKKTFIVRYGLTNALIAMVAASALATIVFLIIPATLFYPIDLDLIALISILPLVSAILALLKRKASREILNKSVTRNVSTLILFIVLVNVYLIII
jgi:1,4-dihydroxy-2-naphthoate polyprenyltransferase